MGKPPSTVLRTEIAPLRRTKPGSSLLASDDETETAVDAKLRISASLEIVSFGDFKDPAEQLSRTEMISTTAVASTEALPHRVLLFLFTGVVSLT